MTEEELSKFAGDLDRFDADPRNLYTSVDAFVNDFLADAYARPVSDQKTGFRWCSRWWSHTEAVARLEALWRAWEALQRDPKTGPATWWLHYCDPTMTALTASDGPFARCSDTTHHLPPALPCEPSRLEEVLDHV